MSLYAQYRNSVEERLFGLPGRSLGGGLGARVRRIAPRLPLSAVVGVRTAAWLHGVDVLPRSVSDADWPVEVIVPPETRLAGGRGLRVYRWRLTDEVEHCGEVLTTTRQRTALDCARVLPRLDAVAAVDRFLRHGVTVDGLRRRVAELADANGSRIVTSVLDVADAGAQSPLESWCRCLIVDAGLPRPSTQQPVRLADGTVVHLDLGFGQYTVGIECDGLRYHGTDADRQRDERRHRLLERAGWLTHRVYAADVVAHPEAMLAEIGWRLRHRGWSPSSRSLAGVERRTRLLGMCQRLSREDWDAAWGIPAPRRRPRD